MTRPGNISNALVAITAINLDSNTYVGYHQQLGQIAIMSSLQPGGHISIPAVGEQWMVKKISGNWYLDTKTDWSDERTVAIPREEGLDVLGTMNGPTHLLGKNVGIKGDSVAITGDEVTVSGSPVTMPEEVTLGKKRLRVNPSTGAVEVHDGTNWVNVIPEAQSDSRLVPAVFKLAQNISTAGAQTTVPMVRLDGNTAYTVTGDGRIILPYTGWYAVSALMRPSTWTANPDSGWIQSLLTYTNNAASTTANIAEVIEPKVGAVTPTHNPNCQAFKCYNINDWLTMRTAHSVTPSGISLNWTLSNNVNISIRWVGPL